MANRIELWAYIKSLSPELQTIFTLADSFVIGAADTLDDDFQIAAEVVALFERHTDRRLDRQHRREVEGVMQSLADEIAAEMVVPAPKVRLDEGE